MLEIHTVNTKAIVTVPVCYCVFPENIHTPTTEGIGNSGGGGERGVKGPGNSRGGGGELEAKFKSRW